MPRFTSMELQCFIVLLLIFTAVAISDDGTEEKHRVTVATIFVGDTSLKII